MANSFLIYIFSIYFLYFVNTNRWLKIVNIIPPSCDDGSFEPKRYSVDFVSQ